MDDLNHCYQILGLEPGAKFEDVKQYYRDLVKVWHPDRFTHDLRLQNKAGKKLKEINEAYERLCYFYSSFQKHSRGKETRQYKSDQASAPKQRNGQPNCQQYEPPSIHWFSINGIMSFSITLILTIFTMFALLYWVKPAYSNLFKLYNVLGLKIIDSIKVITEHLS
jgi:curved DNA-binding protein CbpA